MRGEGKECVCQACGAQLEVQVRFRGKVVWVVDPVRPDFGVSEPVLRGDSGDPRLVCSADALHSSGFRLCDGEIQPEQVDK